MADLSKVYATACRRLREFRGWSQTRLGERVGLTKSTISKIETGRQALDTATLGRLLRAVEVTPTVFHRLCEALELESDALSAPAGQPERADSARPQEGGAVPERTLPVLRQALGPLPGSRSGLWIEVFLARFPDSGPRDGPG